MAIRESTSRGACLDCGKATGGLRCKACDILWRKRAPSTCVRCGTVFNRPSRGGDQRKYCSRACAFADPNWRGNAKRGEVRTELQAQRKER